MLNLCSLHFILIAIPWDRYHDLLMTKVGFISVSRTESSKSGARIFEYKLSVSGPKAFSKIMTQSLGM